MWGWDLSSLAIELPYLIIQEMLSLPGAIDSMMDDGFAWKLSKDGKFSTKSSYGLSMDQEAWETTGDKGQWDWLWRTKTLPKVCIFLWLCCHNKVATASLLNRRGLQNHPNLC